MISLICGIFTVISALTGHWVAAVICGVLTLISLEVSSDERAHYRGQVNRDRYWAYGEEPDWKRKQRAEKMQAERDRARLQKARQTASAGRWDEVPWSLRGKIRKEQEDHDAWMAEQERLAAEKRRKYVERVKRK